MKKFLLMALIGLSVQVMANDEDFDNVEKMPYAPSDFSYRYSDYTETIFLSDIIVEEGAILKTNPAQQYITLKYEDAVRYGRIVFKNDDEKIEQITLAKEYFRRDLQHIFNAIKIQLDEISPCVCGWVTGVWLSYLNYERRFGGYMDESFYIRFHNLDHAIFQAKKEFRNWIISQQK